MATFCLRQVSRRLGARAKVRHECMPGQMILCRLLDTIQNDDAYHGSLFVNTFANTE